MKSRFFLPLLGACALVLTLQGTGCRKTTVPEETPPPADGVARVGDTVITADALRREVARRRRRGRPVPERGELVHEMVLREALLQTAHSQKLPESPELRREIDSLIIGRLKERELLPRLESIEVSDEEVAEEYQRRIDQYTQPAMVRLALLYQPVQPGASDAARREMAERLEEARQRVIKTPPRGGRGVAASGFGALAISHSEDQASRYRGGDIGWFEVGRESARCPKEVLETGFDLEPGAVSDVIETDEGLYVVMKTDKRESSVTPLERVAPALAQSLKTRRRQQLQDEYFEEVFRSSGAVVDSEVLASVKLPELVEERAPVDASAPPSFPGVKGTENGK